MSELSKRLARLVTHHEDKRVRDGWDGAWVSVATTEIEAIVCELESGESKLDSLEKRMGEERVAFFEAIGDKQKAIENRECRLKAAESRLDSLTKALTDILSRSNPETYPFTRATEALTGRIVETSSEIVWPPGEARKLTPEEDAQLGRALLKSVKLVERCDNTPCALDAGHPGECSTVRPYECE